MSLTGEPLVSADGKLNARLDVEWVNRAVAALHYLETHGGNIKQAMEAARTSSERPDHDDSSFWEHELKALQEAFTETGIPYTGWKIPATPAPEPEVATLPPAPAPAIIEQSAGTDPNHPDWCPYDRYLKRLKIRIAQVPPDQREATFRTIAATHASVQIAFSKDHAKIRPMVGITPERVQEILEEKQHWADIEKTMIELDMLLHSEIAQLALRD